MPLCQDDVERSLRILYEVRNLNNNSSNDEEKVAIDQAISILEAHKSSGALAKSPTPSGNENAPSLEFWSRYASTRQSPVVEEGRNVCVLEFASVSAEGLGVELCYGGDDTSRSTSPNGFHTPRSIVVQSIAAGGAASLDGRLQPGDQVLEVNRHTLVRVTLERAKWLLDSAVRQGRVLLAIAEKPGAPQQHHHHHQRRLDRGTEPTLTAYNKRGSLISDLIVHGDYHHHGDSPSFSDAIAEEGESGTLPADMSRRQISRKEARLMRERSLTLPTPTKSESRRLKHAGGFKKRDVRLMHMVNAVPGGLGLEITGGKGSTFGDAGIYVSHVKHAGIADRMGKLRRGDEILMVNGRSLIGMSHAEAQQYLHDLPPGAMQVVVAQIPEAWQDTSSNVFMSPDHTSSRPAATNGERSPSSQTQSPHRVHPVARTAGALVDQWQMKSPMKMAISRSQSLSSTSSEDAMQARAGPKRISSGDLGEIGTPKKERSSLSLRGRTKSFEHVARSRVHPMASGQAGLSASKDSLSGSSSHGQPPSPGKASDMSRLTRVLSAPNVATENTPQEPSLRQEVLTKDRANSNNAQSLTQLVQFPNTDLVPITPWARFTKQGSVRKAAKKQEETIVLVKDGRGLGFTIVGGRGTQRGDLPIIVKTITSEGAAAEDGRLQVGDELVTINGQSLEGATQAQAKQIFKAVKRGVVTLEVRHRQRKAYREITVTLKKEPAVGLGFSIGGVSNGTGPNGRDKYDIYIQFLQEGTAASKDGQAIRGDQIVSVNGTSLESVVLDDAHACFQSLAPGPVDIVLRRRTEKVDAEKQRKQSFSAGLGQRTNSFHESARRLEKAKASSVTVVSDSKGNTLSTERSARRPSVEIEPYLAGTGLQAPSRRNVSPLGLASGPGRAAPEDGEGSAKPVDMIVVPAATVVSATPPHPVPEKPKAHSEQAAVAAAEDLPDQHLKQSSSLMASLSDYFNQSFSSQENSPATQRQAPAHTTAATTATTTDGSTAPALSASSEKRLSMHTQTEEVTLSKAGSAVGLGMTIMGGADTTFGHIIVTDVNKTGPAFGAGVAMGDELVQVNGLPLAGMSGADVIDLLRETRTTVRLLVGKAVAKTPKSQQQRRASSSSGGGGSLSSIVLPAQQQPGEAVGTPTGRHAASSTDGGRDAPSSSSSPPPTLPDVSPPPTTPGSRVASVVVVTSSQQSSPAAAGRVIHRRSLSSVGPPAGTASAPTSNPDLTERRSDSDDSGANDVSIVPMVTRPSRKRTRSTRPLRSGTGFPELHGSSESVRSGAKSPPPLSTPTKSSTATTATAARRSTAVDDDLVPAMLPSSPPPILPPSSYTSALTSMAGSPLSDMIMSTESLSEPAAAQAPATATATATADASSSTVPARPPSPAQYRRSASLSKRSPSLPAARLSPNPPRKPSRGTPPSGHKASTPPPVVPYRPATPPTPTRTPETVRKPSFSSPLAVVGKTDSPSPKTPRKSSLSRMKSSPLPGRGSPKRSAPSPEMTSYTHISESSEYGGSSVTFGKRSDVGLFELQLRKSIAGLGISTQSSRDGTVLVKSAPSGKGADLRAGDQLVKVNGQDVSGMTSAEADSLLKSLPRGKVTLLVRPSSLVSSSRTVVNGIGNGTGHAAVHGASNGKLLSPTANDDSISATSSGLGTSVSTLESSSLDSNKLVSPTSPPNAHRKLSALGDDSKPSSIIHRDPEEGVINIELEQKSGEALGIVIEGGVDTPLQYIFIKDIKAHSAAERNGRLRPGDQIIMFGEDCLVGMDNAMATQVVSAAENCPKIDFVVSRKKTEEKPAVKPLPSPVVPSTTPALQPTPQPAKTTAAAAAAPPPATSPRRPSVKPASHSTQNSATSAEPPQPVVTPDSATEEPRAEGTLLQAATESPPTPAPPLAKQESADEVDGGVQSEIVQPLQPKNEEKSDATNLWNAREVEPEEANRGRSVTEGHPATTGTPTAATEGEKKAGTEANNSQLQVTMPLLVVAKTTEELPAAQAEESPAMPSPALEKASSQTSAPRKSPRPLSRVKDGREGSSPTTAHGTERITVPLNKAGGPLGLAIVGGVDTDIGSILIKRIVPNSAAGRSQLLQTGDCLLSVNGKSVEQATYSQALAALKAAPDDVTLVIARRKQATAAPLKSRRGSTMRRTVKRNDDSRNHDSQATLNDEPGYNAMGSGETIDRHGSDEDFDRVSMSSTTSDRRMRRKMGLSPQSSTNAMSMTMARRAGIVMADVKALELVKGNSGLGFSVAGGKGTPQNGPVLVKTVFEGGPAERSKEVFAGDLLIEVNGKDFTAITRREAVDFLKAIPPGPVRMLICSKAKSK